MKQLIPLLLILLALFYGAGVGACICNQSTVLSQAATQEHLCCRSYESSCSPATGVAHFGIVHTCCGMVGTGLPAVASSAAVFSNPEWIKVKVANLRGALVDLDKFLGQEAVLGVNRAPPRISGFGSSDTYLFKRVLLI